MTARTTPGRRTSAVRELTVLQSTVVDVKATTPDGRTVG